MVNVIKVGTLCIEGDNLIKYEPAVLPNNKDGWSIIVSFKNKCDQY